MVQKDKPQSFSLSSVCWGYRDTFAEKVKTLAQSNLIGDQRPSVTRAFLSLMRCADKRAFDYVIKEFLDAISHQAAWIVDSPDVFVEITRLGRQFAESKPRYGITFFRILGEGGFGDSPRQTRVLIRFLRQLRPIDEDLALCFLRGYSELASSLEPSEIKAYVREAIRLFHQDAESGCRFLQGTHRRSEYVIRSLTQECRLDDVEPILNDLIRALVGYEVELDDLSSLDSDPLMERNSRTVCMHQSLYLPGRIRHFGHTRQNRNWYLLAGITAAGMLVQNSFPRIHGYTGYTTCTDLVGQDRAKLNLFQIVEYTRVLRGMKSTWPGSRQLIELGISTEFEMRTSRSSVDELFLSLMRCDAPCTLGKRLLLDLVDTSASAFDTASLLTPDLVSAVLSFCPGLDQVPLHAISFLPDFLYPVRGSQPPPASLTADLKQPPTRKRRSAEGRSGTLQNVTEGQDRERETGPVEDDLRICFVYNEWNYQEGEYYRDYCHVYEEDASSSASSSTLEDQGALASKIRRTFEMLRPQLGKEKHLSEGDNINIDLLTDYLVLRKREPSPQVNFYEKSFRNRRDLAVLLLLDVSGSTGEQLDHKRTIDVEKQAALVLGEGLSALNDQFAICGFSGHGRENCKFSIFKAFDDPWNEACKSSVLSAHPSGSTRIGAALRHAGYRISQVLAEQRLIILVTDGKPMDAEYDPGCLYAQYDVRKACLENKAMGVVTFSVCTDSDVQEDLEIMFPDGMFTVLSDVRRLPHVLPRLYAGITT